MKNIFTIAWQNQLLHVSREEGEDYYTIDFENGGKRLLEHAAHGWRYVNPEVSNQDEVENELLSEESSIELGLEVEAEEIGKLIEDKKNDAC
ncbi:MAG: hypothetical protein ABJB86_19150 [Bacteroidota bacterium]